MKRGEKEKTEGWEGGKNLREACEKTVSKTKQTKEPTEKMEWRNEESSETKALRGKIEREWRHGKMRKNWESAISYFISKISKFPICSPPWSDHKPMGTEEKTWPKPSPLGWKTKRTPLIGLREVTFWSVNVWETLIGKNLRKPGK